MATSRYNAHTRRIGWFKRVPVKGHKRSRKALIRPRRAGKKVRKAFDARTGAGKGMILLIGAVLEMIAWVAGGTLWTLALIAGGTAAVLLGTSATPKKRKVKKKRTR